MSELIDRELTEGLVHSATILLQIDVCLLWKLSEKLKTLLKFA